MMPALRLRNLYQCDFLARLENRPPDSAWTHGIANVANADSPQAARDTLANYFTGRVPDPDVELDTAGAAISEVVVTDARRLGMLELCPAPVVIYPNT